ncbi:zinc ribbon domain-containing protein [Paenalcaligenes hominis]|uniref:zinc ribbon domain-containing protein n=1 Tax=Paenalcaligenes hominis TaxID=643674 RepID=UPI003614584B
MVRVPPSTRVQNGVVGGWLVAVPPHYTSQTCPECGHCSKANRLTQAAFACVQCSFEEHAEVVGAINVLRAGHAQVACEVSVAVMPPQQEPTEATLGLNASLSAVESPAFRRRMSKPLQRCQGLDDKRHK